MDVYQNNIKPLFMKSGLSNAELERNIGLPRSIIYDWDNGRNKGYKKYADKIAAYFNVSVDYLLTGDDKNKPTEQSGEPIDIPQYVKFDMLMKEQGIDVSTLSEEDIRKLVTVAKTFFQK